MYDQTIPKNNYKMEERITKIVVAQEGVSESHESAFSIELKDEGGGDFITITTPYNGDHISINPEEWEFLRAGINKMIKNCRCDYEV